MAPPSFALVEWIGDEKQDCWQVIKTSQIHVKPEEILVGNLVDATWKRGEETSVAKILKLSGKVVLLVSIWCLIWQL